MTLLLIIVFTFFFPQKHVDIAALLIKYKADVNATDRWMFTPLHEASQKGRTQLCALLVNIYFCSFLPYFPRLMNNLTISLYDNMNLVLFCILFHWNYF